MSKGIIFIIVIVILIIIGVFLFIGFKQTQTPIVSPESEESVELSPEEALPVEQAPQETEEDSRLTKPDAIAPVVVGGDKSGPQLRVFNITISKDGFDPAEITVNHQDRVQFNLTALNGTYDIFMDVFKLYTEIPEGEKHTVSFEAARKGPWKFTCRDHCPEGKTIEGTLTILEK